MSDLSNLKPGDPVVIVGGWGAYSYRPGIVKRLTPTQIILDDSPARYRIAGGYMIGEGDWSRTRLSTNPADFLALRGDMAKKSMTQSFAFSQEGVTAMRAAADRAEAFLREVGKWSNEP